MPPFHWWWRSLILCALQHGSEQNFPYPFSISFLTTVNSFPHCLQARKTRPVWLEYFPLHLREQNNAVSSLAFIMENWFPQYLQTFVVFCFLLYSLLQGLEQNVPVLWFPVIWNFFPQLIQILSSMPFKGLLSLVCHIFLHLMLQKNPHPLFCFILAEFTLISIPQFWHLTILLVHLVGIVSCVISTPAAEKGFVLSYYYIPTFTNGASGSVFILYFHHIYIVCEYTYTLPMHRNCVFFIYTMHNSIIREVNVT